MFIRVIEAIWALTTFFLVVAAIPYAIWLGILAWRKQWRKLAHRALIPLGAYVLLTSVVGGISYYHHTTAHHRVFAVKFDLGTPLFEYNSARAFNGDGYSISVYALPDAVRQRFEHPDPGLLAEFPQRSSDRSHWSVQPWRRAPVDPRFDKYVWFALSAYNQENNQALMSAFADIRAALAGGSAYYSFFHYDHGDHPGNVDFFLVDLAAGKLYLLNQNT